MKIKLLNISNEHPLSRNYESLSFRKIKSIKIQSISPIRAKAMKIPNLRKSQKKAPTKN